MNRLILIGNGFDLAHKMQTSYYSFILWYLKRTFKLSNDQIYNDQLIEVTRYRSIHIDNLDAAENIDFFIEFLQEKPMVSYINQNPSGPNKAFNVTVKSDFVKDLMKSCSHCKWVDIEQKYYLEVLKTLSGNFDSNQKNRIIKKLNDDLEYLKTQLKEFISTQEVDKNFDFITNPYSEEITRGINYKEEANLTKEDIYNIEALIDEGKIKNIFKDKITPLSTMFLNFNYTGTIESYLNNSFIVDRLGYKPLINNIHGSVKTEIVFGFGDEVDEEYVNIEKQNDNEFLRHIKSFYYFNTQHYKDLIRFIESDIYEVYIWGHSCGLSDRTLLNMIFENPKCKSIKIFHHKKSDTENNYTELTQEISRHFKNKQLMRKLIVPFNSNDYMHQY